MKKFSTLKTTPSQNNNSPNDHQAPISQPLFYKYHQSISSNLSFFSPHNSESATIFSDPKTSNQQQRQQRQQKPQEIIKKQRGRNLTKRHKHHQSTIVKSVQIQNDLNKDGHRDMFAITQIPNFSEGTGNFFNQPSNTEDSSDKENIITYRGFKKQNCNSQRTSKSSSKRTNLKKQSIFATPQRSAPSNKQKPNTSSFNNTNSQIYQHNKSKSTPTNQNDKREFTTIKGFQYSAEANSIHQITDERICSFNKKDSDEIIMENDQQSSINIKEPIFEDEEEVQALNIQTEESIQNGAKKRVKYIEETEELFRELERKIEAEKEQKILQSSKRNFYEQLRLKLIKQIDDMSRSYQATEEEKEKLILLLQGCNWERHRRTPNSYFQRLENKKSVSRPNTAIAITQASRQINNLNLGQSKKTIISRPQSSVRLHRKSSSRGLDYDDQGEQNCQKFANTFTCNNRKNRQKYDSIKNSRTVCFGGNDHFVSNFPSLKEAFESMAKRDIQTSLTGQLSKRNATTGASQMHQRSYSQRTFMTSKQINNKLKKEKNRLSHKCNRILNVCEKHIDDQNDARRKLKIFEYYCKNIDKGFDKVSEKITKQLEKL